jgi:uncharacterized membrane protein
MSLSGRKDVSREATRELVRGLKKRSHIKLYEFADYIREIEPEALGRVKFEGSGTDISAVITHRMSDGIALVTDGRYNLGHNPLAIKELSRAPVFTVAIGTHEQTPDLEITDLKAPGFAFRDQETEIEFNLINRANSPGQADVYIKENKVVVAKKSIDLDGKDSLTVTLKIYPAEIGLKNYTLEVDRIPGEVNLSNNTRSFQIQVNRRKIRILYVAGQPSWEYSFFRRLVKSDPLVDLVSFLILRNPENITIVPEHELSLIHFPAREMFTNKIYEFDLLIYDNFSYKRFFPQSYLTHIKNFVLKGGAFIMLGGEDSFARGGYIGTPIEEILPVSMTDSKWLTQTFVPKPENSFSHPVLNLAGEKEASIKIWSEVPELEGYDPSIEPKPGSTVLLKTDKGVPLLAVSNTGKGRTMALNTNSTWRWCMGFAGMGKTPYYYNRFWQKVIRYMIQSGQLKNVQVFAGKEKANLGETVSVNIKVVDRSWNPVNDALVRMEMEKPSGKKVPMGRVHPSGKDGWYHISVPAEEKGLYKIMATAYIDEMFLGEGEAGFTGVAMNAELADTSLNRELLREMARVSGGKYCEGGRTEPEQIIQVINKASQKTRTRKKISWDSPLLYGLLVFIIFLEWYIRRKRGLA